MHYKKLQSCRICDNRNLVEVLDLGDQMLTGVFPREKGAEITRGPLRLVKCMGTHACGLLQLAHSYDTDQMYGDNYGYRSGLNSSMVTHLNGKVKKILGQVELRRGDLVIDIGSNDATTLKAYPSEGPVLVGIDPTGLKFRQYYPTYIQLISDFFSSSLIKERFGSKKAKVITSFSMFYDLEEPLEFMRQVYEVLDDDGIWVFEQSYMPEMLRKNSYDTVCHEHLEFYALHQIQWMAEKVGFKIIEVEFNDINGGSFSLTVSKADRLFMDVSVQEILDREKKEGLDTLIPYQAFASRVKKSKEDLLGFVKDVRSRGKTVGGLGASTKGNVLLQYCGLTADDISFIADVNTEKYGCYTPGSWIPIIPEQDIFSRRADYLIVLPWHFRKFFLENKKFAKLKLVFPLPELSV